jgi:ABC-type transport system involved in multi-copper enzyme maturation permease subunit
MTAAETKRPPFLRARRIGVIALHAFTQLVRMKVFYFLAVFAVILLASNLIDLPQHAGPEAVGAGILRSIKSWSLGTMTLFSVVLGITATALLLPKDVEDRTLYTILAKPVPRLDYLAGKLLGVLLLVFVSLALMDALMTAALHFRTQTVLDQQTRFALTQGWPAEEIASMRADTLAQGPTWSLQGAVVAVFLRAVVMAAIALLLSTFSTSTLFTVIVSFLVYFMGHFQADAFEFARHSSQAGQSTAARLLAGAVALVFPNFQLFNVIDAVIQGAVMPPILLAKLAAVTGYYFILYVFSSWFVFAKKEF